MANPLMEKVNAMMDQRKIPEVDLKWKLLFWVAGGCVVAGGVISVIDLTFAFFQPFDLIESIYLLLFGVMVLALDLPGDNKVARPIKKFVATYFLFLTRFVGRGAWYLFLGCMTFATLWGNSISPFLAFVLGGYTAVTGAIALGYGIKQSVHVDKLRQAIQKKAQNENVHDPELFAAELFGRSDVDKHMLSKVAEDFGVHLSADTMDMLVEALITGVEKGEVVPHEDFAKWLGRGPPTIL